MRKYIIGVSGGPDSMALLEKYKKKIVAVCHVNYHDREDTDNDEQIVKDYCKKNNLILYIFDTKKDDISFYVDKNPQTFYRKIRYDFFLKIAKELNIKKCLIAHNKDDLLETAYMVLEQNKKNLYLGLKRISKYKDLILIRPLLKYTKRKLYDFCIKKEIHFATDYTNFDDIYHRNIVRKILKEYNKKQIFSFYWKIKFFNFKNCYLRNKISFIFKRWSKKNFNIDYLNKQKYQLKVYLFYNFLLINGIEKINSNKINHCLDFICKKSNKHYRLSPNKNLYIEKKLLKIK